MKKKYIDFAYATNKVGSRKAASYIRALELLDPILKEHSEFLDGVSDIWHVNSETKLNAIYDFVKAQKKLGENGIFAKAVDCPPSYWKAGFCDAAVRSFAQFLSILGREQEMDSLIAGANDAAELAKSLNAVELKNQRAFLEEGIKLTSQEGRDAICRVKTRLNQDIFRKMILHFYKGVCCVTGLDVPDVLQASHISSWDEDEKNRLNPENGLCLSATYHAAFDRYLISFDEDYRMVLSKDLKEHYTSDVFHQYFTAFEGKKITLPTKFAPSLNLLAKHREKVAF